MTNTTNNELLLSKFAHELRNPLTSVYSTLQLIELQHSEVKEFKYWSSLGRDLEYMNQLIGELSNFSKANRLQLSSFSSKELIEQVSLSFAAATMQSSIEYTSKIDSSLPIITGDEIKLKEVLRNILQNAYEASLPNHTIFLDATHTNTEFIVRIKDTGCGISEQQLPTIFDPFVTYKKEGTGLGLAICHEIVKAHHGTIEVDSVLGEGTTFTITLPLSQDVSSF